MMENTRSVSWDDPQELGRLAREMSGLEFMELLIKEKLRVPIGMILGFELVEFVVDYPPMNIPTWPGP